MASPLGFRGWGVAGSERLGVRGHGAEGLVGHSCRAWDWIWREPASSLTLHVATQQERISYWMVFWLDSISMDLMSSIGSVWTYTTVHNDFRFTLDRNTFLLMTGIIHISEIPIQESPCGHSTPFLGHFVCRVIVAVLHLLSEFMSKLKIFLQK